MILHRYSKEKFCLGHSLELKGLTLSFPDQICNSPYYQLYNSYNASSENLVLDQIIIPKLIFLFIHITSHQWLILY